MEQHHGAVFLGESPQRLVRQFTNLVQVTYKGKLRRAWRKAFVLPSSILLLFHEKEEREKQEKRKPNGYYGIESH
jgi:hypothetical protein